MDNGTFVEIMLDNLNDYCVAGLIEQDVQFILAQMRDYYNHMTLKMHPIGQRMIARIDLRVKDMLDVIDPMWFVVALYHRNKGGLWEDVHKYGVKPDIYYSYNVENPPPSKSDVYTHKHQTQDSPTL